MRSFFYQNSRNTHKIPDLGIFPGRWEFHKIALLMSYSRDTRKNLCLMTKNTFFSFMTRSQVANYLRKTVTPVFQHKNKIETLKNKVGTKPRNKEWWKTLPNTNKMIKNLFSLIHIRLSAHTHHIWTRTIIQMK